MKKLFLFMFLLVFMFSFVNSSYCYQESANVSNQTGIDTFGCGLNYTGIYLFTNIDASGYMYINYSKPLFTNSSIWLTKHGISTNTAYNSTIPDSCFNYNDKLLILRVQTKPGSSYGECYNGTWNIITNVYTSGTSGSRSGSGLQYLLNDGNWNTFSEFVTGAWMNQSGSTLTYDQGKVYEESIYWNTYIPVPNIIFSNTPSNYMTIGDNITLNITANDLNLDKVWYNYNGTNITITGAISGVYNLSNITLTSNKIITIYANNTFGSLNTTIFDLNYEIFKNLDSYINLTYSGISNPFTINITSPNISSIKLNYNGTNYTAGSYLSGNDTIGSVNVQTPTFSKDQNVSFYWIFTMLDGSIVTNSPKNQTIKFINLGNNYSNLIYNITILDETTGLVIPNINISMTYEVTYGTSNTSIIATNYFNDNKLANKNISSDVSISGGLYMYGNIVYSATGYIGRTYSFLENNISSAKNITLYLSLATTSYVKTMYVTDEGGRSKAALFNQYTMVNGTKTLVATEQLDSTGKTSIVFIPNIQYTFDFFMNGCSNLTKNIIFYDQSDYTQVLSCTTYNPDDYIDPFEGMRVSFFPDGVFNVDNSTNTSNSLFSVNVSGTTSFCDSVSVISFNVYNQLGNTIVNDNSNSCDVLFGSGLFNNFANGSVYILLDSGDEKTLTYKWIKLYSDSDYSNYSILTLLGEVGNSDDILGIDWKFKILISFIGLLGIIIALTIYQRIYNFSNLPILIVADIYIWFMCFIGWGDLNIGATGGGITALVSKYALLILAVIASAGIIATKEDEYS